jgi:molybdopterin converting factor small subunit
VATVRLPVQLARLAGGAQEVTASGTTLREVIEALEKAHPGLRAQLIEGDRLRPGLAAAVDNVLANLRHPVGESSEIVFLPALAGG